MPKEGRRAGDRTGDGRYEGSYEGLPMPADLISARALAPSRKFPVRHARVGREIGRGSRAHGGSSAILESRDRPRLRIGGKTAAHLWRSWPSRANSRPGQPDD